MKSKIKILAIFLVISLLSAFFTEKASAQQGSVSFQIFYDQLSPYGQWVDYGSYGYVWIPNAGPDFAPYSTQGYWIMTDYGWTWVSDYNWGWAPFHYGRWDYDNSFGWFWVPDNEWGPSWVTWREADGYYGWEPMRPGVSVNGSFGGGYNNRNDHWIFVRYGDIDRSNINHYAVNRTEHERIIQNSRVINKTYVDNTRHVTYVSGPAREAVQKTTGRKLSPVSVQENDKPGQQVSNGQLRIYRPQVNKNYNKEKKPAPSKVTNMKDVKRSPENNNIKQAQPANTVAPVHNSNNVQPAEQHKSTPTNNNRNEQPANNAKPVNKNNNAQPAQEHKSIPAENNKQTQPVNNSQPVHNNNVQPTEQHKSNPANNPKPMNNNNRAEPAQQHKSNPPENNRQEQPVNNTKPVNNNQNTQPAQEHKSNPAENNRQQQPVNIAKPVNNNQNTQPSQEHKTTQSDNNKQQQHENNAQPAQQNKSNPPENNKQQ